MGIAEDVEVKSMAEVAWLSPCPSSLLQVYPSQGSNALQGLVSADDKVCATWTAPVVQRAVGANFPAFPDLDEAPVSEPS